MMSLDTIAALERQAAERARGAQLEPYLIQHADEVAAFRENRRFPFPSIGSYVPPGWLLVERYFFAKDGCGDGLALGGEELCERLKPGFAYAIVEEGPFQAYIGEFRRQEWSGVQ